MHNTGCFVICNYGPNEELKGEPLYLGDPTRGVVLFGFFTTNICKAQFFAYKSAAVEDMKRVNKRLEAEKHPLAGHLFIAEVFTRPIVEKKED